MSEQPLIDFAQVRDELRPDTEVVNLKIEDEHNTHFTVAPNNYVVLDIQEKLEKHRPNPRRIECKIAHDTVNSFIDYVQSYQLGAARIFASQKQQSFIAVLDYHEATQASWCKHIASLKLEYSPEFANWHTANNKIQSQLEFAEFIEDHTADILGSAQTPSAADMLEVAHTLEAKRDVKFASIVNLQNGERQFTFEEQTEARTRGNLKIPDTFHISLPIYRGAENECLFVAKLRYRHNRETGAVTFSYKLMDLEATLLHEFNKLAAQIEDATSIKAWMASA